MLVDEGLPIAYEVLERGVVVFASGREQVGTVHHVVAASEKDIFHGLVIEASDGGRHFVEAAYVESLHERGVDLRIEEAAVMQLPAPGGAAPSFGEDPGEAMGWHHWVRRLTLRGEWKRED